MRDRQTDDTYSTQKCPVCNGFGTLKYGSIKCHGCNGRGWITINNKTGLPVEERQIDESENNSH